MTENAVAKEIRDVAFRLHLVAVLASELKKRGLPISRQQPLPVVYEGTRFEMGFRADLVVEDKVIVEIKPWRRSRRCTRSSFSPTCGWRTNDWVC